MGDERCENCAYYSILAHNFQKDKGYERSHCCVMIPMTERKGYVVEVDPHGQCEVFARRADE